MFSHRVPARLDSTPLALAAARARAAGRPLLDLTVTNPTSVGLDYPPGILHSLSDSGGAVYTPDPFGLPVARTAVSGDFARRGLEVPVERIVLTVSTSDAYSLLFKLLCDPGDEVLVPRPSYPLFEHLTALDAVRAVPYTIGHHGAWSIEPNSLRERLSDHTRAILVVTPNNPTGSMLRRDDLAWLADECRSRDVAIISDEVFADYPIDPLPGAIGSVLDATAWPGDLRRDRDGVLLFALGGLSKSAGLPQVKVGWIGTDGPQDLVRQALDRLELICDTYLSVSTPAQVALPALIDGAAPIRAAIAGRIGENARVLAAEASRHPACTLFRIEGGWSAVVRVPAHRSEDELVTELLEEEGVLVHPGYLFDFAHEAFVVLSLLPPADVFATGAARVLDRASSCP